MKTYANLLLFVEPQQIAVFSVFYSPRETKIEPNHKLEMACFYRPTLSEVEISWESDTFACYIAFVWKSRSHLCVLKKTVVSWIMQLYKEKPCPKTNWKLTFKNSSMLRHGLRLICIKSNNDHNFVKICQNLPKFGNFGKIGNLNFSVT